MEDIFLYLDVTAEASLPLGCLGLESEWSQEIGEIEDLGDQVSVWSSVTNRITNRQHRMRNWGTKRAAAQALYRIIRLRSNMISARDAPLLMKKMDETMRKLPQTIADQQVMYTNITAIIDMIGGNLKKFTEAMSNVSMAINEIKDPTMVVSILRTLIRMVAFDDFPTRLVESQHRSTELKQVSSASVWECEMATALTIQITFDFLPIGNGAVEFFVDDSLWATYDKAYQKKAGGNVIMIQGDSFKWRFLYEVGGQKATDTPQEGGEEDQNFYGENKGYRFSIRAMYETGTLEDAKRKRIMVMDYDGLTAQIIKLHSRKQGLVGINEAVQYQINLCVIELMSYLAHLGEEPPHESLLKESSIHHIMFKVIQERPTYMQRNNYDPIYMNDEHVSTSRFYYGLSLSEDGRASFMMYREAVEKIVELAADESMAQASGEASEKVYSPHKVLCHDAAYIIHSLTNFSNKPAVWALPNTLTLLTHGQKPLEFQCQFAVGRTTWSTSFHVFLNGQFNTPGKIAWLVYKGFTANDIQFAIGVGPAENMGAQAGMHPIMIRWTNHAVPYTKRVPNAYIECYKWSHITVAVEDMVMSAIIDGELTLTHEIPGLIPLICFHGTPDLWVGCPGWELQGGECPHAWIYMLSVFGNRALEPNEALFYKSREEVMAWRESCLDFDPAVLGRSGVDNVPDPLQLPIAVKAVFDCRTVVAQRQGIEVLTTLLAEPLEVQKRAAANALRNIADPAVAAGMRQTIKVLSGIKQGSEERRIENVYRVMRECKEAATFDAIVELAVNLLNWEPPIGEKSVDEKVRLELIKNMVLPPEDAELLEGRAPIVMMQLTVCIQLRVNLELLALKEVKAVDTFFKYLALKDPMTVIRTLDFLILLIRKSTKDLREYWAEEMTMRDHFQKLMQMVMRSGDRRIKSLYEELLNYVLKVFIIIK